MTVKQVTLIINGKPLTVKKLRDVVVEMMREV
jgi:hypothetical protein